MDLKQIWLQISTDRHPLLTVPIAKVSAPLRMVLVGGDCTWVGLQDEGADRELTECIKVSLGVLGEIQNYEDVTIEGVDREGDGVLPESLTDDIWLSDALRAYLDEATARAMHTSRLIERTLGIKLLDID